MFVVTATFTFSTKNALHDPSLAYRMQHASNDVRKLQMQQQTLQTDPTRPRPAGVSVHPGSFTMTHVRRLQVS